MASYYLIVNLDKQQYFNPEVFGDLSTRAGLFKGLYSYALGMLACAPNRYEHDSTLVGSWFNNRLFYAFDFDEEISTADDSNFCPTEEIRGIYYLALRSYENISSQILSLVCSNNEEVLSTLISRMLRPLVLGHAECDHYLLLQLGNAAIELGNSDIQDALAENLGDGWIEVYQKMKNQLF